MHGTGRCSIQWARGTTLPDQSPCGGGATSLWVDLGLPRDAEVGQVKWRSKRVDLSSSWLGESVLWAEVGVPGIRCGLGGRWGS